MNKKFYKAFEDKFRGPKEIIKGRLRIYLPFIEPLRDTYPVASVIDLGCGRGEWLELMKENGFSAQGVDLDDEMLSNCRKKGLRVQTGDALEFLKQLPDESQIVISAFHMVEHIVFDELQSLVEEALRVLKPAGILIMETPNPENIVVGTSSFYFDPTHHRPIPPELLAFLPEYYGFKKIKILRLQEQMSLMENKNLSLLTVLNGVSPDYSVIAQKSADNKLLDLNNKSFEVDYGVTLEQLTKIYDNRLHQAEAQAHQAEAQAYQAITILNKITNSYIWKMTAPLRWLDKKIKILHRKGNK